MKKRMIAVISVIFMLGALLSGCGSKVDVKKELVGSRWETVEVMQEETEYMLESYCFEPEEIAYANPEDFAFYRVFTFNEDGTATLEYDLDKTYDALYNGLDKFMTTLYENRADLVDLYGPEVVDECDSVEMFKDFMAYSLGDLDTEEELLTDFADNVVSYYFDVNQYTSNSGTYTVSGNTITTELDEDQNYIFEYDPKTNTFSNGVGDVFTKVE